MLRKLLAPPATIAANLAGLAQACKDEPENDDLRGILADYLEDHDQPERAEYLRASLLVPRGPHEPASHAASHARIGRILRQHGSRWMDGVPGRDPGTTFERGFLSLHCNLEPLRRVHGLAALESMAPWTERLLLHFTRPRMVTEFLASEASSHFTCLNLAGSVGPEITGQLAGSAMAPHWSELVLRLRDQGQAAQPLFASTSRVTGLRHLTLSGCLTSADLRALLRAPFAGKLQTLRLACRRLQAEDLRLLAEKEGFPNLEHLAISCLSLNGTDISSLTAARHWPNLRHLALTDRPRRGDAFLSSLAQWPALASVRHLDLTNNPPSVACLTALAGSPYLKELESLHLSRTGVTEFGMTTLANARSFGRVRVLALGENCRMTPPNLHEFFASDNWPALEDLDLSGTLREISDLRALLDGPIAPRLRRLALNATSIDDEGASLLARSPALANLEALELHGCPIAGDGIRALAESKTLNRLIYLAVGHSASRGPALGALARSGALPALTFLDLRYPLTRDLARVFLKSPRQEGFFAVSDGTPNELSRGFPVSPRW